MPFYDLAQPLCLVEYPASKNLCSLSLRKQSLLNLLCPLEFGNFLNRIEQLTMQQVQGKWFLILGIADAVDSHHGAVCNSNNHVTWLPIFLCLVIFNTCVTTAKRFICSGQVRFHAFGWADFASVVNASRLQSHPHEMVVSVLLNRNFAL